MTLEQQVCSLDLAKRLKELRVKQEGIWHWFKIGVEQFIGIESAVRDEWEESIYGIPDKIATAFTVAELGEMLLERSTNPGTGLGYRFFKDMNNMPVCGWDGQIDFSADTEADARAKMLIYLIENNLITLNAPHQKLTKT